MFCIRFSQRGRKGCLPSLPSRQQIHGVHRRRYVPREFWKGIAQARRRGVAPNLLTDQGSHPSLSAERKPVSVLHQYQHQYSPECRIPQTSQATSPLPPRNSSSPHVLSPAKPSAQTEPSHTSLPPLSTSIPPPPGSPSQGDSSPTAHAADIPPPRKASSPSRSRCRYNSSPRPRGWAAHQGSTPPRTKRCISARPRGAPTVGGS